MPDSVPVGPGTRVTLKFELCLDNGEVVDATGDSPATFDVGDGKLLPGFERAMFGMKAGSSETLNIDAEHGFGLPNEENVHRLKRIEFSSHLELVEGLVVSFSDAEGNEVPGVVSKVYDEIVEVDFNHPLAGRDLKFVVEILDVKQISSEIARG